MQRQKSSDALAEVYVLPDTVFKIKEEEPPLEMIVASDTSVDAEEAESVEDPLAVCDLESASMVTESEERAKPNSEEQYGRGKRFPKKKNYDNYYLHSLPHLREKRSRVTSPDLNSSDEETPSEDESTCPPEDTTVDENVACMHEFPTSEGQSTPLDSSDIHDTLKRISDTVSRMEEKQNIFMGRIESTMESICRRVTRIENTQKEIAEKLINKALLSATTAEVVNQPVFCDKTYDVFPLETWEELIEALDKTMRDEEIRRQLMSTLSKVGGRDLTAVVNGIMRKIMTDRLAQKCNWKGMRGGKHGLLDTPLLFVVHVAVMHNAGYENTSEVSVKNKIQDWLRQAARRVSRHSFSHD